MSESQPQCKRVRQREGGISSDHEVFPMITLFSERPNRSKSPIPSRHRFCCISSGRIVGFGIISAPRSDPSARSFGRAHLDLHSLEARCSGPKLDIEYPQIHPKSTLFRQAGARQRSGYASGSTSTRGLRRCCSRISQACHAREKIPVPQS